MEQILIYFIVLTVAEEDHSGIKALKQGPKPHLYFFQIRKIGTQSFQGQ